MRQDQTYRVAVLQLMESMRSPLAITLDILEGANRAAASCGCVAPFQVMTLQPLEALPDDIDAVVVPGVGCVTIEEVEAFLTSTAGIWAVSCVAQAHQQRAITVTSCASVFVAAQAGALDGAVATTSWFLQGALSTRYPAVDVRADCIVVEDANRLTGGAALAHADVMLAFVERLAGATISELCARYLLLDRRASQRPYMMLSAQIQGDAQLVAAERWVRDHIAESITVSQVAAAVGLGSRTFARRLAATCGLTPIHFIQRIRVDYARARLEQGSSFEAAAYEVGYSDATALRRVFRAHGIVRRRGDTNRSDKAKRGSVRSSEQTSATKK